MMSKQKKLKENIHLLGDLLGEVLVEQEGVALLNTVEEVRGLAKKARSGERECWSVLREILSGLPIAKMQSVARAFSHFLALANIAEQQQRIRRTSAGGRLPPE